MKTRRPDSSPEGQAPSARFSRFAADRIAVGLLLLLPALVYGNTLRNGYHLDDFYRIVDNPGIEEIWPPWRHFVHSSTIATLPSLVVYRPLLPLSLTVNHWLSDTVGVDRRVGLHVGNIALHLASTLLLFFLCRELLALWRPPGLGERRSRQASLLTALLFAVHPISGLPVNYLSKRDLLLMLLFSLAALLLYVRMRAGGRASWRSIAAVAGVFALALLSKEEAAAVLPVAICLELLAPARSGFAASRARFLGALSLLVAAGAAARATWLAGRVSIEYGLTQLQVHVTHYLATIVWPLRVRLMPDVRAVSGLFDPAVLAGAGILAMSLYLAWRWRRTRPLISFCILAYWAFLSPNSSLFALHELSAPYRVYPSMAFLFLALFASALAGRRRWPVWIGGGLLIVCSGVATWSLNRVWLDGRSLWGHHVRFGGAPTAHLNYAVSVWEVDGAAAEKHLLIAAQREPDNVFTKINLGLWWIQAGRVDDGVALVEEAVADHPESAIARHWLASAYEQAGRAPKARSESIKAADLQHGNLAYQYGAAADLQAEGRFEASIPYLRRILRRAPEYEDAQFLYGLAQQESGQLAAAEGAFRTFLERRPYNSRARLRLAATLLALDREREAIEEFQIFLSAGGALSLSPTVHCWLSRYYQLVGETSQDAARSAAVADQSCL